MPLLPVPFIRQDTEYDCGAAVVRAVLQFYGVKLTEEHLIDVLGTNPTSGTHPQRITKFFLERGFPIRGGQMTILEVEQWLDRGVPVILDLQAWSEDPTVDYSTSLDEGHYVIAMGYDEAFVYFSDPSVEGEMVKLTRAELEARWHDTTRGVLFNHYGFAVQGPSPAQRVAKAWLVK